MIPADQALAMGLVNDVVPHNALKDAAVGLAERIMANGPIAVALALEAVDMGFHATTEDALRFESSLFGLLASTEDMREGMAAFLGKRTAEFKGR
jgi:enoyl-CoA hydratase